MAMSLRVCAETNNSAFKYKLLLTSALLKCVQILVALFKGENKT